MDSFDKRIKSNALRRGFLLPLALVIASVASSFTSYSKAKQDIADDLNQALWTLVYENKDAWTCQDTVSALAQLYEVTHKPLIYQAPDLDFRNASLKDTAYFTVALADKKVTAPKIKRGNIASDSIMLVPEVPFNGLAIHVQGFVECSMSSIFAVSDQTVPAGLLVLSISCIASMLVWLRRKEHRLPSEPTSPTLSAQSLDGIKLTPMQRQLTQLFLDAPDNRVNKTALCTALWGNKSNAEESLYTLIRRTKTVLAEANIEISCNRGDSYELRIRR